MLYAMLMGAVLGVCGLGEPGGVSPEAAAWNEPAAAGFMVNTPPGLPAWTRADVEALRTEVRARVSRLRAQPVGEASDIARAELANYLAQAIERGIDVGDLVALDDSGVITDAMAGAITRHLQWHEHVKFANSAASPDARGGEYAYTPSVYGPAVEALAARAGCGWTRR